MRLLEELAINLGLGTAEIETIVETAPARYKVYDIPKRSGGTRTIAQPSRELKALQRYILSTKLVKFPVHKSAMAYLPGKNIARNAEEHLNGNILLKLDFENFFPSILVKDWESFAKKHPVQVIPVEDIKLYSKILFWGQRSRTPRCLSIGAPTSPMLSNLLLFTLDEQLDEAARKCSVNYTRYADDITVSGSTVEQVTAFEKLARKIVKSLRSPRLIFNEEKRGLYTRGQRRMVTGLIITPNGTLSIGRERKRTISAMLHKALLGELDLESTGHLKGLLGFSLANEPLFVNRMREKYGDAIVDRVLRLKLPERILQEGKQG
ncbi:retron St85 family RNA-directed DNA polymerase [Microvirga sp. VF16]|uniref:retron St85 family RNA-directed DNA polymerase n=1 Tax=Microvirga sp. VF16 TaxID=2807101 RepID=UPI00193E5761|nr:retron St85 family RNA-directed DNA polymerase [Microvirga sp. VF16]QRM27900.1 retron St85 family RNA-directed DNA polymerase [Microvirga sp. VF16]